MNFDLFSNADSFQQLRLPEADCVLYPALFTITESDYYLDKLGHTVNWSQETLSMYGKHLKIPRLSAWYGDPNLAYEYSGIRRVSIPWFPLLTDLKNKIESTAGTCFNSVLINLYRDGNDSVDWHSDDEPELGRDPVIASVSFGEQRHFHLKHKNNKLIKESVLLPHGSLLLMRGKTQANYLHKIAKSKRAMSPRINLTFRNIILH